MQDYDRYKSYYYIAVQLSDTGNQINGLVGMLSVKNNDTMALRTLADLYFKSGKNYSALVCARKYLEINPDNIEVLKIQGSAFQAAKYYQEALVVYAELFYRTKESYYKYLQAYIEYELFRQAEALKTIEECLKSDAADKDMIRITYEDNTSEWVPLKAACLNLRGLVYMDLKDEQHSKSSFEEALSVFPDFYLAKENLKAFNR